MSLVMPHLAELFVLNFIAFVVLSAVLLLLARRRQQLRIAVDMLLVGMSAATLHAWNAMGQANPAGMGTLAMWAELALIVLAAIDAVWIVAISTASRSITVGQP
jgi:ACR3 family arsenite efflux pump ArsB